MLGCFRFSRRHRTPNSGPGVVQPVRDARDPQTLAERQQICPITGQRLGSMCESYKVHVEGRDVLLGCRGCVIRSMINPDKYLAKLNP